MGVRAEPKSLWNLRHRGEALDILRVRRQGAVVLGAAVGVLAAALLLCVCAWGVCFSGEARPREK